MAEQAQVNTAATRSGGSPQGQRRTFSPGDSREYDFEVLDVARVVRVVKGGRRFSFRASVVVGDRNGKVGFGVGKSKDVQSAINKGYEKGVKTVIDAVLVDGTVPHEVRSQYGGAKVMLRPARPGTGVIAGGTIRILAEMAGVKDLVSKRLGSANKLNTAKATLKAFESLRATPTSKKKK